MALNFLPGVPSELKPRITVVGVGGAGGNAVNNMIQSRLEGVEFICANTDAQALTGVRTENRIQLGLSTTRGLGAGSRPDVGRAAAEESLEELNDMLNGANMVFITAGMGGGTGTGAAPVIAQAARDMGILTVGVVTKPFHFEGPHRMRTAEAGIEELSKIVDTLIIIPNQNLFRIATERTTFADAFKMADDVLHSGVRGVTDLMVMPGLINLDFADIRCVMSEMGKAMMGTGEAEGDKRALSAAEAAISNPLLDDTSMKGAKGVLINITGGMDMTLFEVDEAANRIRDEVDADANIIFGSTFDEKLNGVMRVSVVATGIASESAQLPKPTTVVPLVAATSQTAIRPQAPAAPAQPQFAAMAQGGAAHAVAHAQAQPAMRPAMSPAVARAPQVNTAAATAAALTAPVSAPMMAAPQVAPQPALRPQPQPQQQPAEELSFRLEPSFAAAPAPAREEPKPHDMDRLTRAVTDIAQTDHHHHHHHTAEEPRKSESIFGRLMRSNRPQRAPEPQALQQQRAPEPQANRSHTQEAAPRFGGMEARQATSVSQSDDLDIPAFLRRSAN